MVLPYYLRVFEGTKVSISGSTEVLPYLAIFVGRASCTVHVRKITEVSKSVRVRVQPGDNF